MTRQLTIADVVRRPLPGMDAPTKVRFTPDGGALTYLQGPPDSTIRSLWHHDLSGEERTLLAGPSDDAVVSRDEQLRRERSREYGDGVTDYQSSDDGAVLVVLAGRLFVSRAGEPVKPLSGIEGVQDARLSPHGRRVAFVQSGDLFMAPVDGGPPLGLTDDAVPDVYNGLAEYIAAEELGRHLGLWWSTDSAQVAFAHVDERDVAPYLIPHLGGERVEVEEHRYPFAGGPNARVSLRVTDAAGGPTRQVELGMASDDYLVRVVAHPLGGWLVAVLPRAQRSLRWLRVEPDGSASELWVEPSTPWLNLDDDTRVLSDGRVLRSTERSGFRHLELRTADGTFDRQLTSGNWVVTGVVHVDEARGEILFTATRDGVPQRHLHVVPLAGGDPERLSNEPGWHETAVSPDGERWVDTWSSLEHAPAVVVRSRDGTPPIVIHQPSATASTLNLPPPELLELCAADGATTLHAAVYRPERAQSESPPPAVVWIYGGPHSQKVVDEWSMTVELHRQMLRQLGFAVVVVDNRGTFNRGLAFEAPLWRQMGHTEIADQAAAARQLAERGELDAERIGITGGSYGGYLTLMAMVLEPQLFRAGVAAAPVTDWHLYDTAYTERYLDTPDANADGYRRSSLIERAGDLAGPALIIHGLVDENVHFRHTARLLAALAETEHDVDLLVFPTERHGERGQAGRRQRQRRALEFLCRHLGQPYPGPLDGD